MSDSIVRKEAINPLIVIKSSWRIWRELTLVMLMIMEVCWVVPWFRSLTPATYSVGVVKAFLIFFTMILVSHLIIRLVNFLRLKVVIRQIIMISCLLVSIFIGFKFLLYSNGTGFLDLIKTPFERFADWTILIPDEFIVAIAVIISWWRGISLAQAHVGPHLVMNSFILGIFMFFIYGFVNTMVTGETPGSLIYVYIFACLLAMSSARMSIIHLLRGGRAGKFNRKWFTGITAAAFIVVSIIVLATTFLGDESGIIRYLTSGVVYIITIIAYLVFSPLVLFLIWIFENIPINLEFFEGMVSSLNNIRTMMQQALSQFGDIFDQTGVPEFITNWGPHLKSIIIWGIIILAIGVVGLWVGIQLWKAQHKIVLEEEQQSILNTKDFWKQIRSSLTDKLKSLWENLPVINILSGARRVHAAERIRQIYIEMLEMCEALNIPRPQAATPIEFMPEIKKIFPEHNEEIEAITLAYTRIRYGQFPEQQGEVDEVVLAWSKLQQKGQVLIQSEKSNKKPPEKVSGGS